MSKNGQNLGDLVLTKTIFKTDWDKQMLEERILEVVEEVIKNSKCIVLFVIFYYYAKKCLLHKLANI